MESVEDFSFKLNTFIWNNVNNKRLEALLYLEIYAMLYFTNVQLGIGVIIAHQALQK